MSTGERDVTTRLRDALAHQTASVPAPEDRWEDVEVRAGQLLRRRRWNRAAYLTIGLAAAVVTVVVAASALEPGSSRRVTTVAPATSPQTPVSRGPGPGPETTTASPAPSTSAPQPASAFHYQPLCPFAAGGGRITGVDESSHGRVLQQSSGSTPIGDRCCVPAGGTDTAWATSVGFAGARDAVVTLVASTGGHLLAVERFAVTAGRR